MAKLIITPRSYTSQKVTNSFTEFSTSSTSYVAVTNARVASQVGLNHIARFKAKDNGGTLTNFRIVGVTSSTVYAEETGVNLNPNDTFLERFLNLGIINTSEDLQLEVSANSGTVTIEADSFIIFAAPLTNITDIFQKAQVTSIRIYGTVTDSIHGITGLGGTDWHEVTINSLMSRFIWSANSGNVIWDWQGSELGVTA